MRAPLQLLAPPPEPAPAVSLPWVRLDANFASHDKVLNLTADTSVPPAVRWQALASYVCALGWAGGQGTDGYLPATALPFFHATKATARALVKHALWEEAIGGWRIRNFEERQELAAVSAGKRAAAQVAGRKANCVRHHGRSCGCWQVAS